MKNPTENLITSSFKIETFSSDGWALDSVATNVTVNFYCVYPCASCNTIDAAQCRSCYPASHQNLYHESKCYSECPTGLMKTENNNCTACESPCATCENAPDECSSCIEGHVLIQGKNRCRE